ncbi:MAG TPA: tetratricopeptide repeat protein [Stellaceae bacterium]|nr:tetratricopeptide repeat protein [Stellaceae bacterium]
MSAKALGLAGIIPVALLLLVPAPAAHAQHLPSVEAEHYARCMAEARRDPAAAWDSALAWRGTGGGHPAEHCAAVALIGLHRYSEAGKRLDKLAAEMAKAPAALRAEVLDQAGQAWLLAGDMARAESALTAALAAAPEDPGLLTDRAEIYGAEKRYREAIADLDHALKRDPERIDALVFRASAYRATGQLEPALRDVEAALRRAPDDPDALLERGNLRRLSGDEAGARQDWQRLAALAPGTPAGAAAKDNLAHLEAGASGKAAPAGKKKAPAKPE